MGPGKAEEGGDSHSVYGCALSAMRELKIWCLVTRVTFDSEDYGAKRLRAFATIGCTFPS